MENDLDCLEQKLKNGQGLPVSWMYDPEQFRYERRAVFDGAWSIVAMAHELDAPGCYATVPLDDKEIIVLRDRCGTLRGFHNVCRHRGHRLLEGRGECRVLTCPYHAWTYGLDGQLRGAPDVDLGNPETRAGLGLIPVAVEAWGPAIFANLDADAVPLSKAYPELAALIAERGIEQEPSFYLEAYETVLSDCVEFAANWKLWYDNSVECYHCGPLHSDSFSAAFDPSPDTMQIDMVGRLISYGFKGKAQHGSNGPVSTDYRSVEFYPGNFITLHDELLLIFAMRPTGPTSGRMHVWYLGRKGSEPSRVMEWIAIWQQTFEEDVSAIETQSEMLKAGTLPHLIYVRGREDPAMFINLLTLAALKTYSISGSTKLKE